MDIVGYIQPFSKTKVVVTAWVLMLAVRTVECANFHIALEAAFVQQSQR